MKRFQQKVGPSIIALLLGALLTLAFSPYEVFPFAILAPAGLFALFLNASPRRAFKFGLLFGLGLFGTGVHWVFISIHTFGDVPAWLAAFITTIFIIILALFPASVGYLSNRFFNRIPSSARLIYVYPAIWVLSEWVRSWIFTGFPWLFLGYSQTDSPLKGYAPILGVYGISLLVLLTSALLVHVVLKFKRHEYIIVYKNLFVILIFWICGSALTLLSWTTPSGPPLSIALVQGNIPQTIKWSPAYLQSSLDRYTSLTQPLWKKDTLIIWPEAAVPLPLQEAEDFINRLDTKAEEAHAHLILGIPIRAEEGGYYNAIITLGTYNQVYLKRHLVPFGEYTPFSSLFAHALTFMNIPMSDMRPGKNRQQPLEINHIKFLPSVCYEIAFPGLMRSTNSSIGVLLTLNNDAWFGESNAQAQHLQMAAMRALELARPVLFVSNNGITAILNEKGQIEAAAPPYQTFVLQGHVQARIGFTPWMRFGSDLILFITFGLLIIAFSLKKK